MGLLDLILNLDATLTEVKGRGDIRRIDAEVAVMQARQRLLEAQRSLANQSQEARFDPLLAEAKGRTLLAQSLRILDDAQRQLQVRQQARALPARDVLPLLEDEYRREAVLLDLDNAYRQLLQGSGGTLPPRPDPRAALPLPPRPLPAPPLPPTPDPPIQQRRSPEEIERTALQAIIRIGALPKDQQEAAWTDWNAMLHSTLPKLVAEEIGKRAATLRSATR